MVFLEKISQEHVNFNLLSVVKFKNYTNYSVYKPFIQGTLYFNQENNLIGKVLCFEESPKSQGLSGSCEIKQDESFCFSFSLDFQQVLLIYVNEKGNNYSELWKNNRAYPLTLEFPVKIIQGGDQQGFYWGMEFQASMAMLEQALETSFSLPMGFNLFKLFYWDKKIEMASLWKKATINQLGTGEILEEIQQNISK